MPVCRLVGFALAALLFFGVRTECRAQTTVVSGAPPIRLAIGFGVDTNANPAREILALWRNYLQETDGPRANAFWARAEQAMYPDVDLLRTFVYQGFTNFTLIHLGPSPGEPGVYELRTFVGRADSATRDVYPLAVYAVYAVREGGRWVLSNALVHRTRAWYRYRVRHIAYAVSSPALMDTLRATRTATYMDSVGTAFGVTVPEISYYAAESLSGIYAALGLDFFPLATDTAGGRALVSQRMVLVGGTTNTESNRHELAHVVLASLSTPRTHRLLAEGLATWIGGSAGLPYTALLPGLAAWLSAHPDATLLGILTNPPRREGTLDVGYNVLAVICALAHERGGVAAVRAIMDGGPAPEDVVRTIARVFGLTPAQVDELWRGRVREGR
ncbi:MAG: hypothetical protein IBJ03_03350 [Gemmatimonadaceae bacterium]|nr:hypothetical protein [Gemmatimonadaceae bacterium]